MLEPSARHPRGHPIISRTKERPVLGRKTSRAPALMPTLRERFSSRPVPPPVKPPHKKVSLEDVLAQMREQGRTPDEEFLRRVYDFSAEMHGDQKRQSGEPFLTHPLYVAYFLAGFRADQTSIAVGSAARRPGGHAHNARDPGRRIRRRSDQPRGWGYQDRQARVRPPGRSSVRDVSQAHSGLGEGHPGDPGQACRQAPQHDDPRAHGSGGQAADLARDARDLRSRSPTASEWQRSREISRISPSTICTR